MKKMTDSESFEYIAGLHRSLGELLLKVNRHEEEIKEMRKEFRGLKNEVETVIFQRGVTNDNTF